MTGRAGERPHAVRHGTGAGCLWIFIVRLRVFAPSRGKNSSNLQQASFCTQSRESHHEKEALAGFEKMSSLTLVF
jgi:hypothetical protein